MTSQDRNENASPVEDDEAERDFNELDTRFEGVSKADQFLQAIRCDPEERSQRELTVIFSEVDRITDPFFQKLEEPVKHALCKRLLFEKFEAGQMVFNYGDRGDKLYLIWSGRVLLEVPRNNDASNPGGVKDLMKFGHFDAGKSFGELALISADCLRNARITAVKPTQFLVLKKDDYMWCVGFSHENFVRERVTFLRSAERAMLYGIREVDLQAMASNMEEARHTGKQVILKQGAEVDKVIFVKSGFCKVLRQLHPKFKSLFDQYAETDPPPPNPFAPTAEDGAFTSCGGAESLEGLRSRERLEDVLRLYKAEYIGSSPAAAPAHAATSKHVQPADFQPLVDRTQSCVAAPVTPRGAAGETCTTPASAGGGAVCATTSLPSRLRPSVADESASEVVVVDILQAGRSFGIMEMMEGLTYQCSVVSDPWAEVYVVTKFDLIRNTSKSILHRLFCDYKARLSDERLLMRLRQRSRWNNYKRSLLDDIQHRKRAARSSVADRTSLTKRTGVGDLSADEVNRVGNGETLWSKRAQTPPRPAYTNKNGKVQHIFRVSCEWEDGSANVQVNPEERDASMAALDEKILVTIARARFRDKIRRGKYSGQDPSMHQSPMTDSCHRSTLGHTDRKSCSRHELSSVGAAQATPTGSPTSTSTGLGSHRKQKDNQHMHPVLAAEELEETSKQAAIEYLEERSHRILAISENAKESAKEKTRCNNVASLPLGRLLAPLPVARSLGSARHSRMVLGIGSVDGTPSLSREVFQDVSPSSVRAARPKLLPAVVAMKAAASRAKKGISS